MATTTLQTITTGEQTTAPAVSGTGASQVASPPGQPTIVSSVQVFGIGSGAGQANQEYAITGTVTAGTPFTIDLNSGNDQFGNGLSMVHVGRVHCVHQGATGKIVVGGGTHPVMGSDQATLQPGGACVFTNAGVGYSVNNNAISGVEPVEALPVTDNSGSGTFTLSYMGLTTAAITYSATVSTLITNINSALDTTFGSGHLVASGASLAALVITGSGGNYQYNAFGGHFTSAIVSGSGFVIGTSTTATAGVAAVGSQQDTLTITADCGVVPFTLIVLGRNA